MIFTNATREYVESAPWKYAKTFAQTWPHEYIMRADMPTGVWEGLAWHIDQNATEEPYYSEKLKYFREDGYLYWVISTDGIYTGVRGVVNRTFEQLSFSNRKRRGLLPYHKAWSGVWPKLTAIDANGRPCWSKNALDILRPLGESMMVQGALF